MARRTLIWHLGLADAARPTVPHALDQHREALAERGVQVVADREEARLATHELLRTHAEAGLRRAEVEGRWAAIADRVWAHRGTSVVSTPDLCAAGKDALRLALDPVIGVEVHVVVTVDPMSEQLYGGWVAELLRGRSTGWRSWCQRVQRPVLEPGRDHEQAERFWAGHELVSVLGRWAWTLRPERVHVLVGEATQQWQELLDLVGVGAAEAAGLPVVPPAPADPASAAVLREVNRRAETALGVAERRAVLESEPEDGERFPLPVRDTTALRDLVGHWEATLAATGYDVRGELAGVLGSAPAVSLPGPRERLAVAAQGLAEALAEEAALRARVADLEAEVEALDRKRRTWKKRAKQQDAPTAEQLPASLPRQAERVG